MNLFTKLLSLLFCSAFAPHLQADIVVLTGAEAYTMTHDAPIKDATIIMENGRISSIGHDIPIPAAAKVINVDGNIVTPGLLNSVSRLGLTEVEALENTVDYQLKTGPLGAAFDIQYALNANSAFIPIARREGLTRAVIVPAASANAPFAGTAALIQLHESSVILDVEKIAMFATIGGPAASNNGGSRSAAWTLLRNAFYETRHYEKHKKRYATQAGRDQLLNRLDIEALLPVLNHKMPLVLSVSRESDIRQAISLSRELELRIIIEGGEEAWRVAAELAENNIPVLIDPLANMPNSHDQLLARLDNAAILQESGVRVSFITKEYVQLSHNAGAALRKVAGVAVANGMPWLAAMQALTLNPAKTWGISDHYGTLSVGNDADLVVWNGDPLEVMTSATLVFVQGKQVSLKTRQTRLAERYKPATLKRRLPPAYR